MVKKPTKAPARAKAKKPKPKAKPKPKSRAKPHAGAKAKRQMKKHQAQRKALRFKVLLGPFARLWAKVPNTVHVPGIDHPVAKGHVVGFVVVLGLAIGVGYWGAQSLLGAKTSEVASRGVILSEPNGQPAMAYEEKALEEVYEPQYPVPMAETPVDPPAEVASLPDELFEPTPVIPEAQPLWLRNALDFDASGQGPMIAIVIDDMGVDRKRSKRMWENVPGPLTLSFMNYANDLSAQTQAARGQGHELMLHVSMEPSNATIDAGPNVLLTSMDTTELRAKVNWGLDRFEGFIGINNHMGSRFTEDPRAMRVVLEEVNRRGLMFLDSRTSPNTVGPKVARDVGIPALERNVFLDNENDVDKVRVQLDRAEALARKRGSVIAIGHPRDATIEVLKTWVLEAQQRGIRIVPVSALMKMRLAIAQAKR
ncbi:divergent polysaccharide deacetylase family protein [Pseudomonadota bacterium]